MKSVLSTTALSLLSILSVVHADSTSKDWTDDATFKAAILNGTNTYRHQHNTAPIEWNNTLAKYAQDWVNDCVWEHSGGPSGENLAAGHASALQAVGAWGDERKDYSFSNPGFTKGTGHFTQLVWKGTTTVGCARKKCEKITEKVENAYYLVCEYYPPGNYVNEGMFEKNVERQVNDEQLGEQGEGQPDGGDAGTGDEANDVQTNQVEAGPKPSVGAWLVSLLAMAVA